MSLGNIDYSPQKAIPDLLLTKTNTISDPGAD